MIGDRADVMSRYESGKLERIDVETKDHLRTRSASAESILNTRREFVRKEGVLGSGGLESVNHPPVPRKKSQIRLSSIPSQSLLSIQSDSSTNR